MILISSAFEFKLWYPVSRPCNWEEMETDFDCSWLPLLSHIFFVDEIILFAEASLDQLLVVKECLDNFYSWSSQKINYMKSSIMFYANVPHLAAFNIVALAQIPCTNDIGMYLMINSRVSKSFFSYLLDKPNEKLVGWKTDMLPFARRVTFC